MFCQNCGEKVSATTIFCPKCGAKLQEPNLNLTNRRSNSTIEYDSDISSNQAPELGYLQEIINSSFKSRLLTGGALSILIALIPVLLLVGYVLVAIKLNVMLVGLQNENSVQLLFVITVGASGILFFILPWLLVSRWGLSIVDQWLTPRYFRHLKKHKSRFSPNVINGIAIRHVRIFANVFKVIGYGIYIIIAIYVILIFIAICAVIGGILGLLGDDRSYHIIPRGVLFPTHWY